MAAPGDDIRLALSIAGSTEFIAVGDYLALSEAQRASVPVTPSWSVLSLVVGGEERWGSRLTLGALGVLVTQFVPAAARLEHGERAVLRAAVFDVPAVLLLLLEPDGEDSVVTTPAVTDDLPDASWTPDGPHGDSLYAFVAAHRDRLIDAGRLRGVMPQHIGRALASAALRREAALGAAVMAIVGPGRC